MHGGSGRGSPRGDQQWQSQWLEFHVNSGRPRAPSATLSGLDCPNTGHMGGRQGPQSPAWAGGGGSGEVTSKAPF